jgi:hypothetical protein
MKDNVQIIAYATLISGIVLLAFTFISAYLFLIADSSITSSSDLIDAFGSTLAPLIGATIRIMYLGVMGWIGSGLTTRGVQLIIQLKRLARTESQPETTPDVKPREPVQDKETDQVDEP